MSGVTGNFAELRELRRRLATLPATNAQIARRAAPEVSRAFLADFDTQRSPYGNPWRPGKRGPITLRKSGAPRDGIRFVPIGTRLRCSLGVSYARYHIFRGLLPRGGAPLPAAWDKAIRDTSLAVLDEHMAGRH